MIDDLARRGGEDNKDARGRDSELELELDPEKTRAPTQTCTHNTHTHANTRGQARGKRGSGGEREAGEGGSRGEGRPEAIDESILPVAEGLPEVGAGENQGRQQLVEVEVKMQFK